jgi:glycosyltransferase involved in cell wall biosynthesis
MHVLHLTSTGAIGGAERSALDILASLRAVHPDWRTSLIAGSDGPLVAAASSIGVSVEVTPYSGALARLGEAGSHRGRLRRAALAGRLAWTVPGAVQYVTNLQQTIDRLHPAVVHTHGLKMHVLAAWAVGTARSGVRPRVVWHLHDYVGTRPATARLLRWSMRHCDAIVTNSESVAADAGRALQPRVPILVVHNAVDLDRFNPRGPRLNLDRIAGMPEAPVGVLRVGLIATFARWKGHTTFLDAMARIDPALPLRGYVIGGPVYQTSGSQVRLDELRAEVQARGLSGRIGFTGFVDDVGSAIRALDVVVHASTEPEPFGLVIAEALACGRAVIASEAGGAREVFTAGVDALAHPPGNASVLAAQITVLARDAGLRHRLAEAGRQTAERRFDRRRLAADLLPAYHQALKAAS